MRLLHIDASPRDERSRSRQVADHYIAALGAQDVTLEVEKLNLWAADLPELGGGMVESRYALIHGQPVDPAHVEAWAEIQRHVDHLLGFDQILISTPMWNFGVPYRLKHYVDVVTQPRMLFDNDATGNVHGRAAGRRAVIVAASAMPMQDEPFASTMDFQLSFLECWLGFIGVTDIHAVRIAPTFGAPEAVDKIMDDAKRQIAAIARAG
jgi:FMN-dependent NADH-azoreductase